MSGHDSKPPTIGRRASLITLGLVRLGTILAGIVLGVFWLVSGVFGPSAGHLAIYSPQCHFGINSGSLVVCRHGQRDSGGNLIADSIDCQTWRGLPPLVDCICGSVAGFRGNYSRFSTGHIEWSIGLPFVPTLAALVAMGGMAHVLKRRLRKPAEPEIESWPHP